MPKEIIQPAIRSKDVFKVTGPKDALKVSVGVRQQATGLWQEINECRLRKISNKGDDMRSLMEEAPRGAEPRDKIDLSVSFFEAFRIIG
jgi:hypothetical protein